MAESLLLWLILLVPIVAQVPLLLYMMRRIHIEEDPPRQHEDIWGQDGLRDWDEVRPDRPGSPAENHRCRRCGTENDPEYRFCGNCVGQL